MTIAAILDGKGTDVVTLDVNTPVNEAVTLLAERKIGAMPVTRDGELCGILSERDVIGCLARDGGCTLDWTAERLMSSPAITVTRETTVQEAMSLMTENHVTGLPVVNSKSQCVGIITAADILNFEQDHAEEASEV
ncbi:MAG: CBS domain-containing protein, partial [Sphingomonadaceae bacterium]